MEGNGSSEARDLSNMIDIALWHRHAWLQGTRLLAFKTNAECFAVLMNNDPKHTAKEK